MDFEGDIQIDGFRLDIEWLEQASLAIKYGKYWARCRETLTRAEERIKVVRAELIKEANEDPDTCLGKGIKPTAVNVEAYYRNHTEHKKAKDEWIKAQYELNMAEVARSEISYTRKAALENLVRLHGQQYFAGPKVPHELPEFRRMKNEEVSTRIARKLKRE